MLRHCVVCLLLALCTVPINSQVSQNCQLPPESQVSHDPNIFNQQQENDLGEVIADQIEHRFGVIEDQTLNDYLEVISRKLLKAVPPTELKFRFRLVDVPEANGFSLAGGRIYLTRKLIAYSRSEDEVAGVLAHEIGHSITHQSAITFTRIFRKVLGVTQVGDRSDIFAKYNLLIENQAKGKKIFQSEAKEEPRGEETADRIAISAMATAGYRPQAYADLWDRIAATEGNTGSFLSDILGVTSPESKRLRSILNLAAALPESCRRNLEHNSEAFNAWKQQVVSARVRFMPDGKAVAEGHDRGLTPPLRDDLVQVKFSPDGRYLLAQDESMIFVLTSKPLKQLFEIEAPAAGRASFSPDSERMVFHTSDLRVEEWSIGREQRLSVHELLTSSECISAALSPDGSTLSCALLTSRDARGSVDLLLVDVASGKTFFTKKNFFQPTSWDLANSRDLTALAWLVPMKFSPDARYFLAAARNSRFAFDLMGRTEMRLPRALSGALSQTLSFDFLSSARLIVSGGYHPETSHIFSFPGGQLLSTVPSGGRALGRGQGTEIGKVTGTTHGDFVILRPIGKYAAGVLELTSNKIVVESNTAVLDVFDELAAYETPDGGIGVLNRAAVPQQLERITLPLSPLFQLRTVMLSPDEKYIAISERARGGVWNVKNGERIFYTRGFRGAHFAEDGSLYALFPQTENHFATIARMHLGGRTIQDGENLSENDVDQSGSVIIKLRSLDMYNRFNGPSLMEALDVRSGTALWSRKFAQGVPARFWSQSADSLVLMWNLEGSSVGKELKFLTLPKAQRAMADKGKGYLVEVVDKRRGVIVGAIVIDAGAGSYRLFDAVATDEQLILSDSENRTLIHSLRTGERVGQVFGRCFGVSASNGLLAIVNRMNEVSVYDPHTMQPVVQFSFGSAVRAAEFNKDGSALLVLSADQVVHRLQLSKSFPS